MKGTWFPGVTNGEFMVAKHVSNRDLYKEFKHTSWCTQQFVERSKERNWRWEWTQTRVYLSDGSLEKLWALIDDSRHQQTPIGPAVDRCVDQQNQKNKKNEIDSHFED